MGLNILIVDDSSTMRSMVRKTLRMSGIPINGLYDAENGKEGLEVLEREHIDMVMLDINMPVMGGLEMVDRMRNNPDLENVPIVVVSTESSSTRIEEIQEKGLVFIHKPFRPEKVREIISNLIGDYQNVDTGNDGSDSF
jgi:two-component system chemotaxis response regulator CheY